MIKTDRLHHAGIMTNYQCNAACRHCLYACSPDRGDSYITKSKAEEVSILLIKGGCCSVHIGGGEPFLNFGGLITLLNVLRQNGIRVEYVETNGFWASDEKKAVDYLQKLDEAGADTLCISLDPFHAEYVPFGLPLRLAEICSKNHFGFFLWQERFLSQLSRTDPGKAHIRGVLEETISKGYVLETARRYGIGIGGRAVNIEEEHTSPKPFDDLLSTKACRNLTSTNHFHVDLYGNFIPPGCTGFVIPLAEMLEGLPDRKYPVFEALYKGGTAELYKYAVKNGFTPDEKYTSNCVLCFYIRKWLSENTDCPELDGEHYEASLSYY